MAGINFNGGSFYRINPKGVRGYGPVPECDKGKEPKDPSELKPKESSKFDGMKRYELPDWQKRW